MTNFEQSSRGVARKIFQCCQTKTVDRFPQPMSEFEAFESIALKYSHGSLSLAKIPKRNLAKSIGLIDFSEMSSSAFPALVEALVQLEDGFENLSSSSKAGVLEACVFLHDLIPSMGEGWVLREAVVGICEFLWKERVPGCDRVASQAILYMILQCLAPDATTESIHRLYNLRGALTVVDLTHKSSDILKHLLLQCVINPTLLRSSGDGRRFLSFLFTIDSGFIDHLHLAIKSQIPFAKASVLQDIAQLYIGAWKLLSRERSDHIESFEMSTIQDLMFACVHCSKSSTRSALLVILHEFHSQRLLDDTNLTTKWESMLTVLYEPILWRSLKSSNPLVRRNSAAVFVDAFPLQDMTLGNNDLDLLLQSQIRVFDELLRDTDHRVRKVGVSGSCRVLALFWDVFPLEIAKQILLTLVQDLVNDACPQGAQIRAEVFVGLKGLLSNPVIHPLLARLLPPLSHMIHDRAEIVRVAFCDLLLAVKDVKAIRFFDVVAVDTLLVRLAMDSSAKVTRKLTELLLNSYLPQDKPVSEQLARALSLLDQNRKAAQVFYTIATEFVPVSAICKLVAVLYQTLGKFCSGNQEPVSEEDSDVENHPSGSLSAFSNQHRVKKKRRKGDKSAPEMDLKLAQSVTFIMTQLWSVAHKAYRSKKTKKAKKELAKFMSETFEDGGIEELLVKFGGHESSSTRAALLSMCAQLDPKCCPSVRECIFEYLYTTSDATEVLPLALCVVSWGLLDHLMDDITLNLKSYIVSLAPKSGKNKSRVSPTRLLRVLSLLTRHEVCRTQLVASNRASKFLGPLMLPIFDLFEATFKLEKSDLSTNDMLLCRDVVKEVMCIALTANASDPRGTGGVIQPSKASIAILERLTLALDLFEASSTFKSTARAHKKRSKKSSKTLCSTIDLAHELVEVSCEFLADMSCLGVFSGPLMYDLPISWMESVPRLPASVYRSLFKLSFQQLPLIGTTALDENFFPFISAMLSHSPTELFGTVHFKHFARAFLGHFSGSSNSTQALQVILSSGLSSSGRSSEDRVYLATGIAGALKNSRKALRDLPAVLQQLFDGQSEEQDVDSDMLESCIGLLSLFGINLSILPTNACE